MQKLVFAFVGLLVGYLVLEYDVIGMAGSNATPEDPSQLLVVGPDGHEAPGTIVAADAPKVFFAKDIFDNPDQLTAVETLADFEFVEQVEGCRFTPPSVGMALANVQVATGGGDSSVYAYSETDMANDLIDWISATTNGQETDIGEKIALRPVGKVNVAVTDSTQILYLVLQSSQSGVIWHIHKMPETRIARVAVIANGTAGVIGLDPAIPVEYLDVSQNEQCVQPDRNPRALPDYDYGREVSRKESYDLSRQRDMRFRQYSTWFLSQFGVPSETTLIGIAKASHVIVGPVPEADAPRLSYVPMDGQTVRVTKNDLVYISPSPEAATTHALSAYSNLLEQASGGRVETITPAPIARDQ
ncbi:hypothetical protein [Pseudaestuariivita rosea]|uniref:hypothetical protein n=1 Tax=Pseudaestuariivita rosea TaxID=2763263 RepID=UPI001ABA0933|nr:hypothetical protein [Pseudaestuariivita rosea]